MPDYKLEVTKTLDYERPEIEKGYTDQTLHINISDADISIKPVEQKTRDTFVGGKAMTCGCCGMPSRRTPAGMIPKTPSASPAARWGAPRSIPVPAKVLSPPFPP